MPGARRGDKSTRRQKLDVRVPAIAFSPTGTGFCAASTEGLLVYSLDNAQQFDPFELDINITPTSTLESIAKRDYLRALAMAFHLNEKSLIRRVYEEIEFSDVELTVKNLPKVYLARLLNLVAQANDESPHFEFNLLWIESILMTHGQYLKDHASYFSSELRTMQKAIAKVQADLSRLADDNIYALDYLLANPAMPLKRQTTIDP